MDLTWFLVIAIIAVIIQSFMLFMALFELGLDHNFSLAAHFIRGR